MTLGNPPSQNRPEPLPGWLTLCTVGGLLSAELVYSGIGQSWITDIGATAHASWLLSALAVSVALGVMLELQVRSVEGSDSAVDAVQRARLHCVIGMLVGSILGGAAAGGRGALNGLALGGAMGTLASVPPLGPRDHLGRARAALVGVVCGGFGALSAIQLYPATRTAVAETAPSEWLFVLGLASLTPLPYFGLRMVQTAFRDQADGLANHAKPVGDIALLAAVCFAAAVLLAPAMNGTPASPGFLIAATALFLWSRAQNWGPDGSGAEN